MAQPAAVVRLLTGLDSSELTDEQILDWLEFAGDEPRLAAAEALEAFATTLLDVASDDITLNGSRRAPILMARAARRRETGAEAEADDGFYFDVVGGTGCRPELTER
jgi:hypothetical protein